MNTWLCSRAGLDVDDNDDDLQLLHTRKLEFLP